VRRAVVVGLAVALAACGSATQRDAAVSPAVPTVSQAQSPTPERRGYYKDDGPGEHPPDNLETLPDAVPRLEPLSRFANRPYSVFGRDYVPATSLRPYRERGIASWYGRKFHNQKTSTGETYDMYAMTAAHPVLPIPSYARVTSLRTGKQVVVRINDRGPFHSNRAIDLSYAAANRLGLIGTGSGEVEIDAIVPR
jgi:rare lipoprotein A